MSDELERIDPEAELAALARFADEPQAAAQGASDWTEEEASDVLLAVGLVGAILRGRLREHA